MVEKFEVLQWSSSQVKVLLTLNTGSGVIASGGSMEIDLASWGQPELLSYNMMSTNHVGTVHMRMSRTVVVIEGFTELKG